VGFRCRLIDGASLITAARAPQLVPKSIQHSAVSAQDFLNQMVQDLERAMEEAQWKQQPSEQRQPTAAATPRQQQSRAMSPIETAFSSLSRTDREV